MEAAAVVSSAFFAILEVQLAVHKHCLLLQSFLYSSVDSEFGACNGRGQGKKEKG